MRGALERLPTIEWFPIEAGHIMMFARAIGDPNPIYCDDNYSASTPLGGVIAPPTFVEAGQHFDLEFPFRPRIGEPWFGSGREPCSVPEREADERGTALHAETHFEYFHALRPRMVLRASTTPGRTWIKHGRRAGQLVFRDWITDYRSLDGEVCVRCRTVGLTTERKVEDADPGASSPAPPDRGPPRRAAPDGRFVRGPVTGWPVTPPLADEVVVGEVHRTALVEDLKRAQILQYAGASGDFSPQHTDEVYNTKVAGYPSVFAHGMLTMGMTGRVLTDWLGNDRLLRFSARFLRQVWPGDDLAAEATVRKVQRDGGQTIVEVDLVTTNQRGEVVLAGDAAARLES